MTEYERRGTDKKTHEDRNKHRGRLREKWPETERRTDRQGRQRRTDTDRDGQTGETKTDRYKYRRGRQRRTDTDEQTGGDKDGHIQI